MLTGFLWHRFSWRHWTTCALLDTRCFSVRCKLDFLVLCGKTSCRKGAASWVRRTVGGLPSRGLGFAAGTVIVGFFSTRRKSAGTYLPPSISIFPCQYHSTTAPYSFIHLPPTMYNVFLPVLQFSPVSIIPPLLHTHSFIYHPRCIMFFPSISVFPCQYHSTIAPYLFIHLPLTL